MSRGSFAIGQQGTKFQVTIQGVVNRDFSFPSAEMLSHASEIEVDTSRLTAMDSEGIRSWIQWLRTLNPAVPFSVVNASSLFMKLASIIVDILPSADCLKSFYVSYVSEDGKEVVSKLIQRNAQGKFLIPKTLDGHELDHFPPKEFRIIAGSYTFV